MKIIKNASLIEKIKEIENQIADLYEKKSNLIHSINISYPDEDEIRVISQNEDGSWNRLTVSDNLKAIQEGFWKSVKVERYSTKLESLKNMPKELKEGS